MTPPPGRIVEVYTEANNRVGVVEFGGKRRAVYLNLVPDAAVGDFVRFHAGFATERIIESGAPDRLPSRDQAGEPGLENERADLAVLQASHLLSELDPDQLRMLLVLTEDKNYRAGDILFREGEKSLFLHLIVAGQVALEEASDGQAIVVQTLHAGDALGWSALRAEALTHFQARALTPVSTIAFPGDKLSALCQRNPAVGYALMKRLVEMLSERLDAMRIRLSDLGKAFEFR